MTMKMNTIITRPLATAALLFAIFASLSSCNSDEPVKPQSAYGPILPDFVPDTLIVHPYEPEPVSTDPAPTVQPPDVLAE